MEHQTHPLFIPASKFKTFLLLLGGLAFVAVGVWLLYYTQHTAKTQWDIIQAYAVGLLSIGFFGPITLLILHALFAKGYGVTLNQQGITIKTNVLMQTMHIPWQDITEFKAFQVERTKLIAIHVNNPETYLTHGNAISRYLMRMGHKMYGTPISIASVGLKISHDELLERLDDFHTQYTRDAQLKEKHLKR